MNDPTDADLTDRELELLERASGYDGSYAARAVAEIRRSRLAALTAAGETDRLCCCGHSAGDHDGGVEAGWGICNVCVCQMFRPATQPPVPAEVVAAAPPPTPAP